MSYEDLKKNGEYFIFNFINLVDLDVEAQSKKTVVDLCSTNLLVY